MAMVSAKYIIYIRPEEHTNQEWCLHRNYCAVYHIFSIQTKRMNDKTMLRTEDYKKENEEKYEESYMSSAKSYIS